MYKLLEDKSREEKRAIQLVEVSVNETRIDDKQSRRIYFQSYIQDMSISQCFDFHYSLFFVFGVFLVFNFFSNSRIKHNKILHFQTKNNIHINVVQRVKCLNLDSTPQRHVFGLNSIYIFIVDR